jgi:DNA repair exonuclease SbcCD ATPase subunit
MLILRELQLNHYLSHEDTKIKFNPDEKLLIDGKSGAGKSSIVEAIIWALYGRGRSESNRGLIKSGKSSARVILTMEDKGLIYRIERSITNAGKNGLKISTGKKLAALKPIEIAGFKLLQDYLEKDLLKSSYLLFINSIAYPQDNVENFVKQTAGKRKDIILEIVNASAYDEYYEKTRELLAGIENKKSGDESSIETLKIRTAVDAVTIQSIPNLEKLVEESKDEITKKDKEHKDLNNEVLEKEKIVAENNAKKNSVATLKSRAEGLGEKIKSINDEYVKTSSFNADAEKEKYKDLEMMRTQLNEYYELAAKRAEWSASMIRIQNEAPPSRAFDSEKEEINRQMIVLLNKPIENCTELNKPCPLIQKEVNIRVEELSKRLEQNRQEQVEYLRLHDLHDQKVKALGEEPPVPSININDFAKSINELDALKKDVESKELTKNAKLGELSRSLEEKTAEKKQVLEEIISIESTIIDDNTDIVAMKAKVRSVEIILEALRDGYNTNSSNLAISKSVKERHDNDITEIESKEEDIKKLEIKIEALKLLKEAFSPKGIKTIVIDYIIPRLEERINEILKLLSDFTIRLDTQRKGVKEDTVKEGLFIDIFNEKGECFDFESYSGGEKLKIIVAISEALSELQNVGFRILDEIFFALDEESVESFSDVMDKLNGRFSQILCISHLRSIKDGFSNKIKIKKIEGTSYAEKTL